MASFCWTKGCNNRMGDDVHCAKHIADRERRRVRRAQADGMSDLYRLWLTLHANKLGLLADSLGIVRNALMRATGKPRSPKKARTR